MSAPDRESIRVLHVDDEPDFAELAATFLEREREEFMVSTATSVTDGVEYLAEAEPPVDCIVSDYNMPGLNGLEFLEAVREEYPDLPFILFTGKGSEEIASEAISAGVSEYLNKESGTDQYTVLANRIANTVAQYRAEHGLRKATERTQRLFGGVTDAIFVLDTEWRFIHLNDRAEELLQRTETELIGENVWDQFSAAVGTTFQQQYEKTMHERVPVEFEEFYPPLDTWFQVRAVPTEDGLTAHFRDISEKKEREQELEAAEARFRSLTENTTLGVVTIDAESRIRYANDAIESLFGHTPQELVGESLSVVIPDRFEAAHFQAIERYLDTGERKLDWEWIELPASHRDGHEFPIGFSFGEYAVDDEPLFTGVLRDITDWKEYEQELERSEDLLNKTQQMTNVGGWELDLRTDELRWTEESYRIHEVPSDYEPELGEGIDFYHPEDVPILEDAIERAIDAGESFDEELRLVTAQGNQRWVRALGDPHRENGETVMLRGTIQDITDRKEQQRRYDAIFNQTFQFTGLMDPDGTLLEANETALKFGGIDPEDVIGEYIWDSYWWEDSSEAQERVREAVARAREGEFVRYEQQVKGAEEPAIIDFSIKPVFDEQGKVVLLIPEGRDITEMKEQERELQRQRDQLRTIVENAPVVLFAFDEEGTITLTEGRGLADLEYDGSDIVGESVFDFFEGMPLVEDARRALDGEAVHSTVDLDDRTLETWYQPIADGPNTDPGVIGVAVDITDLKEREEELRRQNEQLDEFASIVSHDLRNPIGTAEGALELARETGDEKWFSKVETAHGRMRSLIEDVLTLARQGQWIGETQPVSLSAVVTDGWENVATNGAELLQRDNLGTIDADEGRLRVLFENLFRNAIEHGGEDVTVRVGQLPTGFYIEDDGPGIPAGEREQVFEHGHTTSNEGTGFGLAIVATIADAHGWDITVTEGTDGGARFEIRLPNVTVASPRWLTTEG